MHAESVVDLGALGMRLVLLGVNGLYVPLILVGHTTLWLLNMLIFFQIVIDQTMKLYGNYI